MGLTLIHAADLHLDSPFGGFSEEASRFLRQAQAAIPQLLTDCCRSQGAELLLLAGDVFDGPYRRETAVALAQNLEECAVPVFIAPGNHDYLSPDSPWERENWPSNVHIFRGNLSYVDLPELETRVYGGGYTAMDCPGLLEGFRAQRVYPHTVGVLHGDATQAKSPYCPVTAPQIAASGLDYLALGHIHQAGSLRSGSTLCAWPGCPMGRGWDETGAKGILKVTLEQSPKVTPIPLGLPRFQAETVSIEEPEALDGLLPAVPSEDFYRITLTGSGAVSIPGLLQKYARFPHLEFRDRTRPKEDVWTRAGQDSFQGVFFQLLSQAKQEADATEREKVDLAAELTRKILDGEEVALP